MMPQLGVNVIMFEPLLARNTSIFFYFEVFIMYIPFLIFPNFFALPFSSFDRQEKIDMEKRSEGKSDIISKKRQ